MARTNRQTSKDSMKMAMNLEENGNVAKKSRASSVRFASRVENRETISGHRSFFIPQTSQLVNSELGAGTFEGKQVWRAANISFVRWI